MKRMLAVLLLTVAAALPLRATVYYVSPSGNNGNSGTSTGSPWQTIYYGSQRLMAGDTLMIQAGTYYGADAKAQPARGGTSGNPITMRNYPGDQPVQDMQSYGRNDASSYSGAYGASSIPYLVFDGLSIVSARYYWGAFCFYGANNVLVQNCRVSHITGPDGGSHPCGVKVVENSTDVTFRSCLFYDIHATGSEDQNVTAQISYNTVRLRYENCEVYDTRAGFFVKAEDRSTDISRCYIHDVPMFGICGNNSPNLAYDLSAHENIIANVSQQGINMCGDLNNVEGSRIYNNTIYRCNQGIIFGHNPGEQIWNNIVWKASGNNYDLRNITPVAGQPEYCDYNSFYTVPGTYTHTRILWADYGSPRTVYTSLASWQATGRDTHGREGDPLLVAPGTDFHLQAASACRNAGVSAPGGVVDRDMGAYPFGNTTVVGLLPTGTPSVAITSPVATDTYATTLDTVNLSGTASDPGGSIASVTWVNSRGGSGTATGTTSWTISGIALQTGANVITVTAHDGDGNTTTDVLTVSYSTPPTDTNPPAVTQQSPAPNAVNVALDANVAFHVTDAGSGVNQSTVVLRVNGAVVTPTITGTAADLSVFYNPPADFAAASAVAVVVTADDLASTPNHLSTSWSFTCVDPVAPDTTPPGISGQLPAPDAADMPLNATIRFHLTDAQSGVDQGTIALQVGGTAVTPDLSGADADVTVVYTPPALLPAETTVTVRVTASDNDGNVMAAVSWSFVTASAGTVIEPPPPPTGVTLYPSGTTIVVMFVASTGEHVAGYNVYYRNGTAGYRVVDAGDATSCVLSDLQPGTSYHVVVKAYDTAGQESVGTPEVSATTEGGTSGETESVNALEVKPNRLSLLDGGSAQVGAPVSFAGNSVAVYGVSGTTTGSIDLGEDAAATLDPASLDLQAGLYILVLRSGETKYEARLVVTP